MAVGGALFGNRGSSASKALVEFRAGKMSVSGNLVTPDRRKGMVQVEQGDDSLMHFKWKDRGTGVVEDDLIIFPDDIEFVRVNQCTTGRVFVLKFKSSSRKMFFWMQEPKEDKDEEYCKKVNDYLNKPPSGGSGSSDLSSLGGSLGSQLGQGGAGGVDLSSLADTGLQSLLSNMNQQQLMQLFGSAAGGGSGFKGSRSRAGPNAAAVARLASTLAGQSPRTASPTASAPREGGSGSTPATPAPASSAAATTATTTETPVGNAPVQIQLTDLQSVLSGIKVPEGMEGAAGGSKEPTVDLSTGITGEVIKPLLTNPDFVSKMKKLLPTSEQNEATSDKVAGELVDSTIKSPQFKQALQMFSSGLQSGQLAPLINEFNLGDDAVAAAAAGNLEAFVKAIQGGAKKPENPDEEMGGLD